MTKLEPLSAITTRTERAYAAIRDAILSFRLEPGALLLEDELAEQLTVSKTPVRNALQKLERDGLVTRIPYKGTYVTEITDQDIKELVQIKAVLEGLAGRLAAGSLTPTELDQAEKILNASNEAFAAGDLDEASDLGFQFHEFIFERVPSMRLRSMLHLVDTQMHRLRHLAIRTAGRTEKSIAEHQHILEALRRGDSDGAELAFRNHLQSFLDDMSSDEEALNI